jgi:hypothetical protein
MFYTGIITSLIPYILLLGVFGTLFLNQALPGAQEEDDHSPGHHQQEGTVVSKAKENPSSFYLALSETEADNQQGEQPAWETIRSIPVFSPPGASTHYFEQPAHQDKLQGMNRTYSFRGPPQI